MPPVSENVRPTADKVKEAVFGILQTEIAGAVVIDLFAGTGGLGVEALSRGAKKVFFCDVSKSSLEVVKKNTSFCNPREYEIMRGDFADCVSRLSADGVKADVIICDPPYGKDLNIAALDAIGKSGLLRAGGTVLCERRDTDKAARKYFAYVSSRNYGGIVLDVYKNITKCAVTGSFDPFTKGHRFVVENALSKYGFAYVVMLVNPDKEMRYRLETRLRMAELSLKEYKKRVKIESYGGMTTDYCAENGIDTVYRGYRNEKDAEYENKMAEYNKSRGGIDTVIIKSENEISSAAVKDIYDKGGDVSALVSEDIVGLLSHR